MKILDLILALIPLIPSLVCIFFINDHHIKALILCSLSISLAGYLLVSLLIPVFSRYNLKSGLSGKDLGKKFEKSEHKDVPEALGLVSGTVYIICTIFSQLLFATNDKQLVIYNSALFSICFMIFLGFIDDTVDLKWRYKLFLPTLGSLPLLMTYSGSTAMYVPKLFAPLFMNNHQLTLFGSFINLFFTIDTQANGQIIELGIYFMIFMGLQAVFCTNAINILAGINGIECGQSYIIAASILFFKLYELDLGSQGLDVQYNMFAIVLIIPFIGTALGLLQYNWYPAKVFVGDTFCYFAGMTFAVIGIHSHFSKTLLLLFIPQIFNFLYSLPQLFKIIPCPRHRLPQKLTDSNALTYSTFPCKSTEFRFFKVHRSDTFCPNLTIINLFLRLFGPMHEKSLCILLLAFQFFCSLVAFYLRYFLLEN